MNVSIFSSCNRQSSVSQSAPSAIGRGARLCLLHGFVLLFLICLKVIKSVCVKESYFVAHVVGGGVEFKTSKCVKGDI
jgi:hypothetical protein